VTTAHRDPANGIDPAVETAPAEGWRRWAHYLTHAAPERLVGFSGAIALGFLAGLFFMWAFVKVADDVLEQETAALDAGVASHLLQVTSPELTAIMRAVSLMGSEAVWVIGVGLLGLFAWQRRWGAATILVLAAGGAQLLNDLLKGVFHRTRPLPIGGLFITEQQYSFPSGHAMVSAAFYLYLAYLTWRLVHGWKRTVLISLLVLLVVLIGVSRIYLQAHYFSDVVAGYLAGFLWTDAVIIGSRLLVARPRRRHSRATLNV
jgi:membrane-associated phospholipid phosphatase